MTESQADSLGFPLLSAAAAGAVGKVEICAKLGQMAVSGQLNKIVRELLNEGLIEHTILEKLQSRLQKYRLPSNGKKAMSRQARKGI